MTTWSPLLSGAGEGEATGTVRWVGGGPGLSCSASETRPLLPRSGLGVGFRGGAWRRGGRIAFLVCFLFPGTVFEKKNSRSKERGRCAWWWDPAGTHERDGETSWDEMKSESTVLIQLSISSRGVVFWGAEVRRGR